VVVRLSGGEADTGLLRLVLEEEKRSNSALPLDSLIALALFRRERRVDTAEISRAIQRDEAAARNVLERLVEAGLAVAHGVKKGRTYTFSPDGYRKLGNASGYVRQADFDLIQQEQMVVQYVRANGRITRREAADLCRLSPDQAKRLLARLQQEGKLVLRGARRWAFYEAGPRM
jgi:ATP-dependent DNA helicase RecG